MRSSRFSKAPGVREHRSGGLKAFRMIEAISGQLSFRIYSFARIVIALSPQGNGISCSMILRHCSSLLLLLLLLLFLLQQ